MTLFEMKLLYILKKPYLNIFNLHISIYIYGMNLNKPCENSSLDYLGCFVAVFFFWLFGHLFKSN